MKGFPTVAWFLYGWGIGEVFWQMTFLIRLVYSRELLVCLQKPHLPAAHDLSLAANICPVSLWKNHIARVHSRPRGYALGLLHCQSCLPSNKNILLHPGSRLIRRGFPEVSNFFVFEKAYPCLFSSEFWKNASTTECLTSGISSRDEVQSSVEMASPSRNFLTSRSSAFRFPFLLSSWIQ